MTKKDIERFKAKLLSEKSELESSLSEVSVRNPSNPSEWEATAVGMEVDAADDNEVADKMEEIEDNKGITANLDAQLKEVDAALDRIKNGTYGICEKCGKAIAAERLEANPSARTCVNH